MAAYAFDTLAADLLCAVCDPENTASAHVMKKLGMRYRGIENWYEVDDAVYEITRTEWQARSAI